MYYSNLLYFTLSLQMKQSVQTNEPGVSKMYICITQCLGIPKAYKMCTVPVLIKAPL